MLCIDFAASVGNFAVERACWLYSLHVRAIFCLQLTNFKRQIVLKTELTTRYLFFDFRETKILVNYLRFWIRGDVNSRTVVILIFNTACLYITGQTGIRYSNFAAYYRDASREGEGKG